MKTNKYKLVRFIKPPLDGKTCQWEDINGKTSVGIYCSKEDLFLEEDGSFVFKQFVKKWKYV